MTCLRFKFSFKSILKNHSIFWGRKDNTVIGSLFFKVSLYPLSIFYDTNFGLHFPYRKPNMLIHLPLRISNPYFFSYQCPMHDFVSFCFIQFIYLLKYHYYTLKKNILVMVSLSCILIIGRKVIFLLLFQNDLSYSITFPLLYILK